MVYNATGPLGAWSLDVANRKIHITGKLLAQRMTDVQTHRKHVRKQFIVSEIIFIGIMLANTWKGG